MYSLPSGSAQKSPQKWKNLQSIYVVFLANKSWLKNVKWYVEGPDAIAKQILGS